MTTAFESHVQFSKGFNSSILILCLVGIFLNSFLLYIFSTRKQVRRSVYSIYMIQITITDLVVCVIWLLMASMQLKDLPPGSDLTSDIKEDIIELREGIEPDDDTQFTIHRLTYAVYYFHSYYNIFLLAIMSTERCVAVMKSLRCQRYQFEKRVIYIASFFAWLAALICAIPTFIYPTLITQNEYSNNWMPDENQTTNTVFNISEMAPTTAIAQCHKPLAKALELNLAEVTDCCQVSVDQCLDLFDRYGNIYSDSLEEKLGVAAPPSSYEIPSEVPFDLYNFEDLFGDNFTAYDDFNGYNAVTDDVTGVDEFERKVKAYQLLWQITFELIRYEVETGDLDSMCDPKVSQTAKIYLIIVNLAIGFFVPYLAIVITNLAIAFAIRVRAQSRLDSDNIEEVSLVGRRVSGFFRQLSHGLSRSEAESCRRDSPPALRSVRTKTNKNRNEYFICNPNDPKELLTKNPNTAIYLQPATPATSPQHEANVKTRDRKLRLSSQSNQFRRTSGGSGSSAESFLTDVTSLQTSPSPAVRPSAPQFAQSCESRALIQRACSADSGNGSGEQSLPSSVRRWSSDGVRVGIDEKRILEVDENHGLQEEDAVEYSKNDEKLSSILPSRVERFESTQELLGSHGRIYYPHQSKHRGQPHHISRNRAYSAASRTSAGGSNSGTMRQTVVHKHAVKQMRVSRTVLSYVIAFTLCWLPQKIVFLIYITEGMIGMGGHFCNVLNSSVRLVSFLYVLLNPIVYAVTQRELRHLVRDIITRLRKNVAKIKTNTVPREENGATDNNERNLSRSVINRYTTDEMSRSERHARNKETRSRLNQRLGRPNLRFSHSATGISAHDKPSDGTIDEEREDERNHSSKGQSSSTSFRLNYTTSNGEDWKQLIDMADSKNGHCHSNGSGNDTRI